MADPDTWGESETMSAANTDRYGRTALPRLTSPPKPGKPGHGRPAGQRNRRKAPIRDPSKKAKRDKTMRERQ